MQVTQATAHTKERTEHHCARCGHRAAADVFGIGQGAQSFLNPEGTAERRAQEDARKDIERTIRLARCPKCRQRNPGALLGFWTPFLIMFAAFLGGGIVLGYLPTWADMNMAQRDRDICKWVVPLILGGTAALFVPIAALTRWSGLDRRITWVERASPGSDPRPPAA